MTRLLCPECGAPAIENPRSVLPLSSNGATTLYRCRRGHLFDYPFIGEPTGIPGVTVLDPSFDPDAARRARIRPAMEVGDDADAE